MRFFVRTSKNQDTNDYVSIYARVRHLAEDKKYAIGLKVLPSEWEKYSTNQYSPSNWMSSLNISYSQFNDILTKIKEKLETEFNPETAAEDIKKIREQHTFLPKKNKVVTCKDRYFSTYLQEYIEGYKNGKHLKEGTAVPVSKGYIRILNTLYNTILKYEEEYGSMTFDAIDMKFRDKFIPWCQQRKQSSNYIASNLDLVRMVMKSAFLNRLTKNDIHLQPNFVPKYKTVDTIYLTMEQIEEMRTFDFNSPESYRKINEVYASKHKGQGIYYPSIILTGINIARDLFIVGCLTGQRESDYFRINKNMICNLRRTRFIKIKQIKTQKTVMIPLDKRVDEILTRYGGKMPKINDKLFNDNLHLICEVLGWTWEVNLDNAMKKFAPASRFCDFVTSHTARRSFATNAYKAGISLSAIMAITGHAREDGLKRYLRLNDAEKAVIAGNDMKGFIESMD